MAFSKHCSPCTFIHPFLLIMNLMLIVQSAAIIFYVMDSQSVPRNQEKGKNGSLFFKINSERIIMIMVGKNMDQESVSKSCSDSERQSECKFLFLKSITTLKRTYYEVKYRFWGTFLHWPLYGCWHYLSHITLIQIFPNKGFSDMSGNSANYFHSECQVD